MLYLETRDLKIAQITKILLRYDVEASISNNAIKLEGEISDELVSELLDSITILSISNFQENSNSNDDISGHPIVYHEMLKRNDCKLLSITDEYELRYANPKAGEVYMCDFGIPYGKELGGVRPALVVSTEDLNDLVVVVPFKSKIIHAPVKYHIQQSDEMFDEIMHPEYSKQHGGLDFANERSVDKKRLRDYFGKLKTEIFYDSREYLFSIFGIDSERLYSSEMWLNNFLVTHNINADIKKQILTSVKLERFEKVCKSKKPEANKIKAILELFNFDANDWRVYYLHNIIRLSLRSTSINMDGLLCRLIQSEETKKSDNHYTKQEVSSFIEAVVQEKYNSSNFTAFEFIYLIWDIIRRNK